MPRKPVHVIDRHIAGKIRLRRLELGLSEGHVAKRLGRTRQAYAKYEQASTRVNGYMIYQLATILRVSPGYFFEGLPDTGAKAPDYKRILTEENLAFLEAAAPLLPEERQTLIKAIRNTVRKRRRQEREAS